MKILKSCTFALLIFVLTLNAFALSAPEINTKTAILVDQNTGEILYEKASHDKAYPASTTKIMTAVIALEKGNPEDQVTVTESAVSGLSEMGSGANLTVGETYVLKDLIRYMLIASGNDSCNVIAEHIAGSQTAFVDLMNQKASELGCKDSHFTNAHGLHDENHYTSAYDLYLVAKHALQIPAFAEICSLDEVEISPINNPSKVLKYYTTNNLISKKRDPKYYYQWAKGIKTGFTTPAGYCLVSSASKNGVDLISVVTGAKEDPQTKLIGSFTETKKLFEWGFSNFTSKTLLKSSEPIAEVPVGIAKDKDFVVLVPSANIERLVPRDLDIASLTRETKVDENVDAPIKKGQVLGSITLSSGGKVYGSTDLVALNDIERSNVLYYLRCISNFFHSLWFKLAAAILVAIVIFFIAATILSNRKRKRARRYSGNRRRRR